jgi:hypothetical protein
MRASAPREVAPPRREVNHGQRRIARVEARHRRPHACHHVVDVGEIKHPRGPRHAQPLAPQRPSHHRWHHPVDVIARAPIHAREAQRRPYQALRPRGFEHVLRVAFAAPVRVAGPPRRVLGDGQHLRPAVHLAAARDDHPRSRGALQRGFDHHARALHVGALTPRRVAFAPRHPRHRREVHDARAARHRPGHRRRVADVPVRRARRTQVEPARRNPRRRETRAERTADRPRRARHQDGGPHGAVGGRCIVSSPTITRTIFRARRHTPSCT